MNQVLAVNAAPEEPRGLVLQPEHTKLTTALAGLSPALTLLSRDLLLVVPSAVTDQEDLLEAPVVSLRPPDDEGIAVGESVGLSRSEEGVECGVAASWRGGQHIALDNRRAGRAGLTHHGGGGAVNEVLIESQLRIDHGHVLRGVHDISGRRVLRS
jgi:hypothetical protein